MGQWEKANVFKDQSEKFNYADRGDNSGVQYTKIL